MDTHPFECVLLHLCSHFISFFFFVTISLSFIVSNFMCLLELYKDITVYLVEVQYCFVEDVFIALPSFIQLNGGRVDLSVHCFGMMIIIICVQIFFFNLKVGFCLLLWCMLYQTYYIPLSLHCRLYLVLISKCWHAKHTKI